MTSMNVNVRKLELFKVIEREDRNEWRKVGEGVPRPDGSISMILDGVGDERSLVAVPIDRAARPIPEGKDERRYPSHELFEEQARVGVLFVNRDGSFTVVIDDGQREGPKLRLQLRQAKARRNSRWSERSAA